ncbi:hypothetical protein HKX48_000051 [Thoreauomyces humboldtii]|nr:hypothetical protein HKX48_000051 [Thoreauomyces humboldtii]
MTEPALPRQAPADFDKPQKSLEEQLAELEDLQIPSMDLDESASPRNGSTLAYGLVSSTSFAPMPRSTSSASYSQSPLLVADPEGSYYAPPVAHPINESSVPPNSNAIRPSMRSRSNSSYRAASDGYDPSQVNEALQGYERPSVTATRSSRRSSIVATISNAFKGSGEQGGAIKRGADQGTDWAAGSYAAY